jgi:hypothetical protein
MAPAETTPPTRRDIDMTDMMTQLLGPFFHAVILGSLAIVIVKRQSIRKRHIVRLLAVTVLGSVAFVALMLVGIASIEGGAVLTMLYMGLLRVVSVAVIGCASVIGFSFMLKLLGLAPLED